MQGYDEFYILVSREAVGHPPATMPPRWSRSIRWSASSACIARVSSIRDSASSRPPCARGVLEVRSREVPFILEHGQIVGRLVFERLTDPPPEAYGEGLGSNYQRQGLKLSKHFRSG